MNCPRCGNDKIVTAMVGEIPEQGRECRQCKLVWLHLEWGISAYWHKEDVQRVPRGTLPVFAESKE